MLDNSFLAASLHHFPLPMFQGLPEHLNHGRTPELVDLSPLLNSCQTLPSPFRQTIEIPVPPYASEHTVAPLSPYAAATSSPPETMSSQLCNFSIYANATSQQPRPSHALSPKDRVSKKNKKQRRAKSEFEMRKGVYATEVDPSASSLNQAPYDDLQKELQEKQEALDILTKKFQIQTLENNVLRESLQFLLQQKRGF